MTKYLDALSLSLEVLISYRIVIKKYRYAFEKGEVAIDAIKEALAQPEQGLGFQCEPQPAVTEDGFTDWVCPKPLGYLMQCCGCNLIHEVETRVAHYEPRPSEDFAVVADPNTQVQWRMKRRDDLSGICSECSGTGTVSGSQTIFNCPKCTGVTA